MHARATLLAAVTVVVMVAAPVKAQEQEEFAGMTTDPAPEETADEGGAGLVLELDHGDGTDGPAGRADMQPRELADSDVELILGGAGSDGMAKRGRLKKED